MPHYGIPELRAEELNRVQIHPSPEHGRQLILHAEELQPGGVPRLKLHQHIHVAGICEIATQNMSRTAPAS